MHDPRRAPIGLTLRQPILFVQRADGLYLPVPAIAFDRFHR
jgi:hypothetical protein